VLEETQYPLVMVKLFSKPDEELLSQSSGTVYLCDPWESLTVVPITSIHLVVAMFPDLHVDPSGDISQRGKYSLMQHPYIDIVQFTGDPMLGDEDKGDEEAELD
jgi:hypothetical protein